MDEEATPLDSLLANSFFCHKCNREISSVLLPEFTCPTCHCGFIETLNNPPEQNDESDVDIDQHILLDELASNIYGLQQNSFASPAEERRAARLRRRPRMRQMREAPLEALIQDFVMNLTQGGWGGSNTIGVGTGRGAGAPVLLLGNPGDYAWGREGLDAIVTQLLNQMDTTGPPPLTKDKINEIPTTAITKEQVDISLQCSVCWEDFKVDEPVRKLPCEHVYHENCIIPWLELHGTCPICRKTLMDDGRSGDESDSSSSNVVVGNSLATLFRLNCCIGQTNHFWYMMFLISNFCQLILASNLILTTACHPFKVWGSIMLPDDCSDVYFDILYAICFVTAIYCMEAAVFVFAVLLHECWLVSLGITGQEYRNRSKRSLCCGIFMPRPYSKGIIRNWFLFWRGADITHPQLKI